MTGKNSRIRSQAGYLLLSVMLLITLMLIAMAVEAPRIAQQIQRGKEEELVHRGMEYAKAIKKYQRKMGRPPTSIEQLENTNHFRFLRKRYKDPMTGKADWKLIHVGQAEIPLPKGTLPGSPSPPSANPKPPPKDPTDHTPPKGPTFGGGGIIGVASVSKKSGIKEFHDSSEYDEWLFVYDLRLEQAFGQNFSATAGIIVAAPAAGGGGSSGGSPSPSPSPQSPK